MKNIFPLLLCFFALCNIFPILASKRIKRNATKEHNRLNISKDFVVLHSKGNNKTSEMKSKGAGDPQSLYDTVLESLADTKTQVLNNLGRSIERKNHESYIQDSNAMKKRGLVLHKRERNPNDSLNITHLPLEREDFPKLSAPERHSKYLLDHKSDKSDFASLFPLRSGTANIVGVHVILPSQTITSESLNPFDPIAQMMRYANMLFYKVGIDSPSENMDLHNSIESREDGQQFMTSPMAFPQRLDKANGNAWILNKPLSTNESEVFIDLMGENLNDEESGNLCPLHHNKKPLHSGSFENTNIDNALDDEGLIQVCSCHFEKNPKEAVDKELK